MSPFQIAIVLFPFPVNRSDDPRGGGVSRRRARHPGRSHLPPHAAGRVGAAAAAAGRQAAGQVPSHLH